MFFNIEKMRAAGQVHIQVFGPNGELKEERKVKNLVVDDGLEHIANRLVHHHLLLVCLIWKLAQEQLLQLLEIVLFNQLLLPRVLR